MLYAIKNNEDMYESIIFKASIIQTQSKLNDIILYARIKDNEFSLYMHIPRKNTVTFIDDIPIYADIKLMSKSPFWYDFPLLDINYIEKNKVNDFLYEMQYGNIEYDYAYEHFKSPYTGGCSAVRSGQYFGHNFDWFYNNQVSFIIHTPETLNRYSVIGIASNIPGITTSNVNHSSIIIHGVDMFKLLPFYLTDGINQFGLFATYNITPLDDIDNPTKVILASVSEYDYVPIPMLVRFLLDNFKNANEAINYILKYTTLYFPDEMIEAGYLAHIMIGDFNTTYIIEFNNNKLNIIKLNYITNFNISDVLFNKNMTLKYPPTQYGVNKYGFGLERWDIIASKYNNKMTYDDLVQLMDDIKYSNCYGEKFWISELIKKYDDNGNIITVDTNKDICQNAILEAKLNYNTKDRMHPKVWITCHSSIYDIYHKILFIKNQENQETYVFILT